MKIPKHITDALGRPRCVCPICKGSAEVTASGTIARHKRYGASSWSGFQCEGTATTAPEGAALEWLKRQLDAERGHAAGLRESARKDLELAEKRDAMAAELEKIIARESGKGTSK